MRTFGKGHLGKRRERALVYVSDPELRDETTGMLSSFGYRVDQARGRLHATRSFLTERHEVIVTEAALLPRYPLRLKRLYALAHREPVVFIAAAQREVGELRQYLADEPGYHLLHLPFDKDDFAFTFERSLHFRRQSTDHLFQRDLLFLLLGGLPVLILLAVLITLHLR